MELILAVVVVAAVIFFGALISAGNERQRKAIDSLREQTALWAVQDLRIKRERLVREVHIDDPLGWLNGMATKVSGRDLNLQVVEVYEEPQTLVCASRDGSTTVTFTPLSLKEIRRMSRERRNRLSKIANRHPLLFLSRDVLALELSVLNCGFLFDLELPLAWKSLTGQGSEQMERLWMYMI